MMCALSDKNLPRAQSEGHLEATDAASFSLCELHWRWAEMPRFDLAVCRISLREMLSLQAAGVHLYCQCYHWGPGLIFSSFHYMFISCSRIGCVEICQENHMFCLQTRVLADTSGRTHLNCLIMDSGYDSLSHQERSSK